MLNFENLILRGGLLVTIACGCSVADLVEESKREADRGVAALCDACVETEDEREMCEADFYWRPFDDVECVVEALDIDKKRSRETLECILDSQREYTACLANDFECNWDGYLRRDGGHPSRLLCPLLPSVSVLLRFLPV